MSAIPCASVSLKTMADGTLRISFDIEPKDAQDAFRLFAAPGTPAAIAALQVGYVAAPSTAKVAPHIEDKPKGGALAKLAGMWCNDPEFQAWLQIEGDFGSPPSPDECAGIIRGWCGISSRSELDNSKLAYDKFNLIFRGPYSKHLMARGIVT